MDAFATAVERTVGNVGCGPAVPEHSSTLGRYLTGHQLDGTTILLKTRRSPRERAVPERPIRVVSIDRIATGS